MITITALKILLAIGRVYCTTDSVLLIEISSAPGVPVPGKTHTTKQHRAHLTHTHTESHTHTHAHAYTHILVGVLF